MLLAMAASAPLQPAKLELMATDAATASLPQCAKAEDYLPEVSPGLSRLSCWRAAPRGLGMSLGAEELGFEGPPKLFAAADSMASRLSPWPDGALVGWASEVDAPCPDVRLLEERLRLLDLHRRSF